MTFSVVGRGLSHGGRRNRCRDDRRHGTGGRRGRQCGVPRVRGVPAALPPAGLGGARAGADLAGDAVRVPPGAAQRLRPQRHRGGPDQPARDRGALGPEHARRPAPGRGLAGPALGHDLRPAARGRARGPGPRADRPAVRPVLHRHQADLAGRERPVRLGGSHGRRRRGRHRRQLPGRPADRRANGTSRTRRTPRGPCSTTSTRAPGRTSSASCSAYRGRHCPGSCRRTAKWAAPLPARSSGWTCRWRASRATSRRRCSARPASPRASRSAPTAPGRSCS